MKNTLLIIFCLSLFASSAFSQKKAEPTRSDSLVHVIDSLRANDARLKWRLDSLEIVKGQEERLLDKAQDRFGHAMTLLDIVLIIAGLIAIAIGWLGKRAIDRFDSRVKTISDAANKAQVELQQIFRLREEARIAADEIGKYVPNNTQTAETKVALTPELISKLEEYDRRLSVVESLGGTLTAEEQFKRGNSLYMSGNYEDAIRAYDKATLINPQLFEPYYNKGNALAALGRHSEAISVYNLAISLRPESYSSHYNKGNSLRKIGRDEEAITAYDAAIAINPDYHEALNNRGNVLCALGRYDEAKSAFEKGLKIAPKEVLMIANMARVNSLLGNKEEMLKWLELVINTDAQWRESVKANTDFAAYFNDPDFRKLVGLPPLEEGGSPE